MGGSVFLSRAMREKKNENDHGLNYTLYSPVSRIPGAWADESGKPHKVADTA